MEAFGKRNGLLFDLSVHSKMRHKMNVDDPTKMNEPVLSFVRSINYRQWDIRLLIIISNVDNFATGD